MTCLFHLLNTALIAFGQVCTANIGAHFAAVLNFVQKSEQFPSKQV
jgi:hypothetical protein